MSRTQATIKRSERMELLAFMSAMLLVMGAPSAALSEDFYARTCPEMEAIVRQVMVEKLGAGQNITAPSTLRLFFHDCFVQGCDASVLIVSTAGNKAERDAPINLSLAGDAFDAVVRAKTALERACPGTVSCADILAVLARDATFLTGGPSWAVKKGRRDSRTSTAARAAADLPPSTSTYPDLLRRFRARNLTDIDLVTLSGAHTIGSAHCAEFAGRLRRPDPSMDPDFRAHLLSFCQQPAPDPEVVVFFDQATPLGFDNGFYKAVAARRGLLGSDQSVGEGMAVAVALYAANQTLFFENFAAAMDRLGEVGVLSGEEGEIRRDCLKIN